MDHVEGKHIWLNLTKGHIPGLLSEIEFWEKFCSRSQNTIQFFVCERKYPLR